MIFILSFLTLIGHADRASASASASAASTAASTVVAASTRTGTDAVTTATKESIEGSHDRGNLFFADLEAVLQMNASLKSELVRLTASKDLVLSRSLAWTPTMSLGVGGTQGGSTPFVDLWKADASWNLLKGGGDRAALHAAQAGLRAQGLKVRNEELVVESAAATLIFQLLYSADIIKHTQDLVRMRTESHRVVVEKFKRGHLPQQEVTKSEIDQKQQENRLRTLQAESLEIEAKLRAFLSDRTKTTKWPFDQRTQPKLEFSAKSPEILRAEELVKAADAQVSVAKSGFWPSLDLTATYRELPLRSRAQSDWSASLLLTIPLYDRFETTALRSSAEADLAAAEAALDFAVRTENAKREVLQRRLDLQRKNLEDASTNVERAAKLYQDMLKSFGLGRMSVNDLLIEQNRTIESAVSLSQNQLAFHKVVIETCLISGTKLRDCVR